MIQLLMILLRGRSLCLWVANLCKQINFSCRAQAAQKTIGSGADNTAYAFAVRWNGITSVKMLGAMLKEGIKVRVTENAF